MSLRPLTTSPMWIAILSAMRSSAPSLPRCSATAACTACAHSTASSALGNSASTPSPVDLTITPWCLAACGRMISSRIDIQRACVRRSSDAIRIE